MKIIKKYVAFDGKEFEYSRYGRKKITEYTLSQIQEFIDQTITKNLKERFPVNNGSPVLERSIIYKVILCLCDNIDDAKKLNKMTDHLIELDQAFKSEDENEEE